MTLTLPGADIRGYYQALGIELPGWASTEASVRCFASPDGHRRGDRDPCCSVNLEHGAWHCHASTPGLIYAGWVPQDHGSSWGAAV